MQFLALCQEHYAVWSGNIHVAMLGILCSILAGSLVDVDLPLLKSIHRLVKSLLFAFALWISGLCIDQPDTKQIAGALHPACSVLRPIVKIESPWKPKFQHGFLQGVFYNTLLHRPVKLTVEKCIW